jgi:hypothetical protein
MTFVIREEKSLKECETRNEIPDIKAVQETKIQRGKIRRRVNCLLAN